MSRKHAELEREFIEDLEPRTGRSLAGWMTLIDATGLADRNAIIDWLRPQGLTFAHASWLERIHHNGGRPIYGNAPERPREAAPGSASPPTPPTTFTQPAPAAPATRPPPPRPSAAAPLAASGAITDLLERGKGLRPLAEMLLREIAKALPGLVTAPAGDLISVQRPAEFAVLLVGPRELRLGLDLGDWPAEGPLTRARIPGTTARITHMMVFNDARQIGAALFELVKRADARANPPRSQ